MIKMKIIFIVAVLLLLSIKYFNWLFQSYNNITITIIINISENKKFQFFSLMLHENSLDNINENKEKIIYRNQSNKQEYINNIICLFLFFFV